MNERTVVLLSGGIDSAACVHYLHNCGKKTECFFVDYGQPAASQERKSAQLISEALKSPLLSATLDAERSFDTGEILGRNAFLIMTVLLSTNIRAGSLNIGIHSGTRYYDCTEGFIHSIDRLVAEYTDGRVRVGAPFLFWSKEQVFDYYIASGLAVDITYSCEAGHNPPCGRCLSCLDRRRLGCSP